MIIVLLSAFEMVKLWEHRQIKYSLKEKAKEEVADWVEHPVNTSNVSEHVPKAVDCANVFGTFILIFKNLNLFILPNLI